jgi:phosphatidate cytidylyltransferase
MHKARLLTAMGLIPLVLLGLFYLPVIYLRAITVIIMLAAAWEWGRMLALPKQSLFKFMAGMALLVIAIGMLLTQLQWLYKLAWFFGLGWLLIAGYLMASAYRTKPWTAHRGYSTLAGYFVLGSFGVGLNGLLSLPLGAMGLLGLLSLIWAADSGAYYAGRAYGKHLLLPQVSPKKTWEGVAGGMLAANITALCLAWLIAYYANIALINWKNFGLLQLLLGISIVGDLFESLIKRAHHVKDSGGLLPGHGGLLDRLDSLMAALPFFMVIYWAEINQYW